MTSTKKTVLLRVDVETREILEALRSYPKEPFNSIILRMVEALCGNLDSDIEQKEIKDFGK